MSGLNPAPPENQGASRAGRHPKRELILTLGNIAKAVLEQRINSNVGFNHSGISPRDKSMLQG